MPSPTQKSTQVSTVIGFSKNSFDSSVVEKSPPANATISSSVRRTMSGRPSQRTDG